MILILVLCLIGGCIVGAIADSKGDAFLPWAIFGALLFIIALPMVLLLVPSTAALDRRAIANGGMKCPSCAEIIRREAAVCRFCGRDLPNKT